MGLGIKGMGCSECCDPCVGCQCGSGSQVQITASWGNYVCDGCTDLNTIVVPWVSSWSYIGNGDTCISGGSLCDLSCDVTKPACYYQLYLEPDCAPPDLIPYLFCGGNCTEDLPCTIEDNCSSGPGDPACGTIGTGILPTDFIRPGCDATCSASPFCDYSAGWVDEFDEPYGECVGGYGGSLADCYPFAFHVRVKIYQHEDPSKTVVLLSIVVDGQGLKARTGCAIYDGPCGDDLNVDITLDYSCLSPIPLQACTWPTTFNVQII